jgi:hypothetical protein
MRYLRIGTMIACRDAKSENVGEGGACREKVIAEFKGSFKTKIQNDKGEK